LGAAGEDVDFVSDRMRKVLNVKVE